MCSLCRKLRFSALSFSSLSLAEPSLSRTRKHRSDVSEFALLACDQEKYQASKQLMVDAEAAEQSTNPPTPDLEYPYPPDLDSQILIPAAFRVLTCRSPSGSPFEGRGRALIAASYRHIVTSPSPTPLQPVISISISISISSPHPATESSASTPYSVDLWLRRPASATEYTVLPLERKRLSSAVCPPAFVPSSI